MDELEHLHKMQAAFLRQLAPRRCKLIELMVENKKSAIIGTHIRHESQWHLHIDEPNPTEFRHVRGPALAASTVGGRALPLILSTRQSLSLR